ncbi:MAG: hypothetical protein ACRDBL_11020 [Rhabdaerophilum sp.]
MASAIQRGRDEFIASNKANFEGVGQTSIDKEAWSEILALAKKERHFSPLSDAEWAIVKLSIERGGRAEFDETSIRRAVDDAALSSGYFSAFGIYIGPDRHTLTTLISDRKKIAVKVDDIIQLLDFTGEEEFLSHDLKAFQRKMLSQKDNYNRKLSKISDPAANAKIPESIARWGALLVRLWSAHLGLPVKQGVKLQRFIVGCASPYGRYVSNAQARWFLKRYIKGEVIDAGAPISEVLRD